MALTFSKMLDLNTELPFFDLPNVLDNQKFSSLDLSKNKPKLIMFICNHCPFVKHYHKEIVEIAKKYIDKVEILAISSNDAVKYPEDGPDKMKELAIQLNISFPYLYDETQEVAKKFNAQCTPEFYLFDKNNLLIYRGRLDESTPQNEKEITGVDLRVAIENYLEGKDIIKNQYPSVGCNIKWK